MFKSRIAASPALQVIPATLLVALLGCGGPYGPDPGPAGLPDLGLSNVVTENTAAREATISEEGGSLTVTDSNGVVYTLTVPESALSGDTVIGMYPIDGVTTLPAGAQVAGGVHFVPDGLVLQLSATLTMEFPASTNLLSLFAVGYDADGADPTLNVSRADAQTLTVQVQHFSGEIAVGGEDALAALGIEAPGAVGFINRIAAASAGFEPGDPAVTGAVVPIYREWYENHVKPILIVGSTESLTDANFDIPRQEYEAWRAVATMTGLLEPLSDLGIERADSIPRAAAYLTNRYNFFNAQCVANAGGGVTASDGPVAKAARALDVGPIARGWELPLVENNLDDEFLLDNLCVKVVFDTLLPDGLDSPGDTGGLTVGATFTIAGGAARNDIPIRIRLTRGGTAFGTPSSGLLDTPGFFESQITWPSGVDPLTIDVFARLDRSGLRGIARFDRLTIGCTPPQVNTVSPAIAGENRAGVFIAEITGTPSSFAWDFGGGANPNTSTDAEPSVTFGDVGTFTGSLTIGDDCGSSTVFFFTYEVRPIPFISQEFVGTLTEFSPTFGIDIDCAGPGLARFDFSTLSGFDEFRIQYEFDCNIGDRAPGLSLIFIFNSEDVTETGFVTRDGFGVGTFDAGVLSFASDNGSNIITFEGIVAP